MLDKTVTSADIMKQEDIVQSEEFKIFSKPAYRKLTKLSDSEYLDLFLELEVWEAPKYIREGFKYKFAGYDSKNRPVWLSTCRNCPIREVIERRDEELLEKYAWQAFRCVVKSICAKSQEENPSRSAVCVLDAQDLSLCQFVHARTIAVMFKYARKYKDAVQEEDWRGIGVNVNRVGRWILNLTRPILYKAMERMEVYGTDESEWGPRLRQLFGTDEIPDFEGDYHCFPRRCIDTQKNKSLDK